MAERISHCEQLVLSNLANGTVPNGLFGSNPARGLLVQVLPQSTLSSRNYLKDPCLQVHAILLKVGMAGTDLGKPLAVHPLSQERPLPHCSCLVQQR